MDYIDIINGAIPEQNRFRVFKTLFEKYENRVVLIGITYKDFDGDSGSPRVNENLGEHYIGSADVFNILDVCPELFTSDDRVSDEGSESFNGYNHQLCITDITDRLKDDILRLETLLSLVK